MRFLFTLSRGFRMRLLWCVLLGVASVGFGFAFIYVSKCLVDIATGRLAADFWTYVWVLAGCLMLRLAISGMHIWVSGRLYQQLFNGLRSQLFDTILNAPWHGREDRLSGDVMSRINEDLRVVVTCLASDIPATVLAVVQLLSAVWFLFVMQPRLLLILLIIMPLSLFFTKVYYRRVRQLTHEIRSEEAGINSHIQENVQNRPLLLSFRRTSLMVERLIGRQQHLLDTYSIRLRFTTLTRILVQAGFSVGYYTAFVWSAVGIMAGTVTYGMMTAMLQLVAQVQSPIINLSTLFPSFVKSMASADRIRELTADAKPEPLPRRVEWEGGDAASAASAPFGLRLSHITFRYPGASADVLHDFSYTFEPGSSTAIVGPTGSGKSTLIRLLLGLLQPQSGEIVYLTPSQPHNLITSQPHNLPTSQPHNLITSQPHNLPTSQPHNLITSQPHNLPTSQPHNLTTSQPHNLSYVPQGNSLLSGTIRDNLLLGRLDATDEDLRDALRRASALFVYDLPQGLDTLCGEKGAGLSEGQAQRIAIARALLQPGSILILDEASSALDPATERQIIEELQQQRLGKTLIWVTHHPAVADVLDRQLTIE